MPKSLTATTASGGTVTLNFGVASPNAEGSYVQAEGAERIYVMAKEKVESIFIPTSELFPEPASPDPDSQVEQN